MCNKPKCFLACVFLFQSLFLWATPELDVQPPEALGMSLADIQFTRDGIPPRGGWAWDDPAPDISPPRERMAFNNRTFELSLAQTSLNASNTFLAAADVFQNPFRILGNLIAADSFAAFRDDTTLYYRDLISINLDNFFHGFGLNLGLDLAPLSININIGDRWGFGLDIAHVRATGNLYLPENLLGLYEVTGQRLGAGAAVFAEFGVPVFFHTRERGVRVRIRPAAFVPLVFVRPGVTYSFGPSHEGGLLGQRLELSYDMQIFSIFNLSGLAGNGDLDLMGDIIANPGGSARNIAARNMGYDVSVGLEYSLTRRLSVGVDLVNIPIPFFPATLHDYARLQGSVFIDTSFIDIEDLINNGRFPSEAIGVPDDMEPTLGTVTRGHRIFRPFTMLFNANFRPFETDTLSLIPSLGFSVNSLYAQRAALEGGLSVRFDLANFFITTIGVNYNDRRWRNSLDFAFNFRVLELGIGISSQSPNFVQSFRGAGLGVNFGIKMGW